MSKIHGNGQQFLHRQQHVIEYYDILSVEAYYSRDMIIFILHFSLVHPDKLNHYYLFSIQKTNFIPPSPYLTMKYKLYTNQQFKKFDPNFLCSSSSIQMQNKSSDCITRILQLSKEKAVYQYIPILIYTKLIEKVTTTHYIAIFPQSTKIFTQCEYSRIQQL